MSLYFFNFRQGDAYSIDDQGCEFESVEDAYLGAVKATQEMWLELLVRREDPLLCSFDVSDSRGNDLFTLPFSEVLESCHGRPASAALAPLSTQLARALATRRAANDAVNGVKHAMRQAHSTLSETVSLLEQVIKIAGQ